MEKNQYTARISLTERSFEVVGDKAFVDEYTDKFIKLIEETPVAKVAPKGTAPQSATSNNDTEEVGLNEKVYFSDGDNIEIIASIPGSSTQMKAINAAILYLYGLSKLKNEKSAPKDEIIKVCKEHACFDSTNFSAHMKKGKPEIVPNKSAGTIAITVPGIQTAKDLIKEIVNGSEN